MHIIRIFIYDFFYYLYKYGSTLMPISWHGHFSKAKLVTYPKIKSVNVYELNYFP